jgi:putative mRNA 3-end processing factor
MPPNALVTVTPDGLYCPVGNFHIDPWKPVARALITHAHSDHARWGSDQYLTAQPGQHVLQTRLGPEARITSVPYGESIEHHGVKVSFYPAGHVLGSAQIRLEHAGEVWVVSGDYKLEADPTCTTFEPVRCNTFITESTFALPVYRWPPTREIFDSINSWWRVNQEAGKTSVIFAYSLGKAQRLLAGIDATIGPIHTHGAVERMTQAYRDSGVELPATQYVGDAAKSRGKPWAGSLVIAPPSADNSPWARKFAPASSAIASGWMAVRGTRRRRAVDRGFPLSDHADWPGLLQAIEASGATRVLATHGFSGVLARWLIEHGIEAGVVTTQFGDEEGADPTVESPP